MKSLLQTKEWANFKVQTGWKAQEIEGLEVLSRSLFLGKNMSYAPETEWRKIKNAECRIKNEINKKFKNNVFFRLEIVDEYSEEIIAQLKDAGFVKAFEETQPEWRQIIDISKPEEEILVQMKEKGRYNIKVAQKRGVIIEKSQNIDNFYHLFQETAKRDGFNIRPREYFAKLMQILEPAGLAELLVARYNENILAAEIVTYYDGVASYLYGASSSEHREVMAPSLLHWHAIRRAKEKGCKTYDLLAVAPPEQEDRMKNGELRIKNANFHNSKFIIHNSSIHKYAGISRFKRQFGGKTVRIVGGWDYVFQPFWYKIFEIMEKMRRN